MYGQELSLRPFLSARRKHGDTDASMHVNTRYSDRYRANCPKLLKVDGAYSRKFHNGGDRPAKCLVHTMPAKSLETPCIRLSHKC